LKAEDFPEATGFMAIPLVLAFILSPAAFAGAEMPATPGISDPVKKRIAREKQFLQRAVEELDKSQAYVQETIKGLEKQIEALEMLEPARRENDLGEFRDWYKNYANWLKAKAIAFETDLTRAFSAEPAPRGWTDRYDEMVKGYGRQAGQLANKVRLLEKIRDKTKARILELQLVLENHEILVEQEKQRKRAEQRQPDRDRPVNDQEARFKILSDEESRLLWSELRMLDEMPQHYEVLIELGRYELHWLSLKAADSDALNVVAKVIGNDSPAPIEDAYNGAIRTYEFDITSLGKKIEDLDRKRSSIVRTGTLATLERLEELSEYYGTMKKRYEHHIGWLGEQIGSYRADLVLLGKEI
jgi:prefoldin subunit 5